MLREFFANRLAHFRIRLADKIVGNCEPADVGYSLQVPDVGFIYFEYDTRGSIAKGYTRTAMIE